MEEQSSIERTLTEREETHGNFMSHASLSQGLKSVMTQGKNWTSLPSDQREALEMIVHKIARVLNGDYYHIDSWHDIAGYATLVEKRLVKISQTDEEFSACHYMTTTAKNAAK